MEEGWVCIRCSELDSSIPSLRTPPAYTVTCLPLQEVLHGGGHELHCSGAGLDVELLGSLWAAGPVSDRKGGFATAVCPSPRVLSSAVIHNDPSDEGKIKLYQAESKVNSPQARCTRQPVT